MKKSLITLAVMLTAVALVTVFCGPAAAKVTGVCGDCHTMHNSQDGDPTATGGPYTALLMDDCVGCHSSSDSSPTKTIGESTVPVVYNLSKPNYNPGTLAGGNFWWVADKGGDDDAKGHNVLGISGVDSLEKAPGGFSCGGVDNCHKSLAEKQIPFPQFGSGCQGCHLRPAHHADDSDTVIGKEMYSTDGYYRFLSGHSLDPVDSGYGVCGIEDSDWQASCSAGDHNEYLGFSEEDKKEPIVSSMYTAFSSINHNTMTAFCCGCHGKFHQEKNTSGEWIRHPSDAVIPDEGEYADAFGANGTGTGIYDPLVPVARATLTSVTATVTIGGDSPDMVMCLSCHRPHGSPYDDLLRWDYGDMLAGGGSNTTGCFACHTRKDTGS
ncbi:MAG: cytochrome c3 family protein [Deltaproteobacteria bacterium]|nr:cytochrome c3 family protein [Deltaproteobacteria bacterium]